MSVCTLCSWGDEHWPLLWAMSPPLAPQRRAGVSLWGLSFFCSWLQSNSNTCLCLFSPSLVFPLHCRHQVQTGLWHWPLSFLQHLGEGSRVISRYMYWKRRTLLLAWGGSRGCAEESRYLRYPDGSSSPLFQANRGGLRRSTGREEGERKGSVCLHCARRFSCSPFPPRPIWCLSACLKILLRLHSPLSILVFV